MKFENILHEHKKTKLYNIFGYEGIKPCLEKFKECFWEILDNFSITKQNLDRNDENKRNILQLFDIVTTQIENQFKSIDKNEFEILIDHLILKIYEERKNKYVENSDIVLYIK
jgi:hypothetical protein